MQATITITLPYELQSTLEDVAREVGKSPEELLSEARQDYLFTRRFRLLREHMISKAREQGVHTDADVFDRVS